MSMNEAESKPNVLLPLGVVGEKSFSDPTSDTWKNKKADPSVGFSWWAESVANFCKYYLKKQEKKTDSYNLRLFIKS